MRRSHRPVSCLLLAVWFALTLAAAEPAAPQSFSVREFGAKGDGRTLDTSAVNRAIDAAAAAGGGIVSFSAGQYLCHSIHLQSRIELRLDAGATIIAADPPAAGETGGYDAAEPNRWAEYQDFGHSHWHNSLLWGEGLDQVSITGPGRIEGRGLSRGTGRIALPIGALPSTYDPANPPDVLSADGPRPETPGLDLTPGRFGYPNARDTLPDGAGNKAIALKNCRNVTLRDFTILHGGHFGILATGVDNLTIDNLTIDTNRDGMDIDACSNVRIANCSVNSPWDDGICLKASHALGVARPTENVTITACFVSGFDEGTLLDGTRQQRVIRHGGPIGRIKLGTEAGGGFRNIAIANCVFDSCRGLALEQVDGGLLEDVAVSNLTMRNIVNAPIFIRLGARLRRPDTTQPGRVRRISIANVVAANVAPDHGIMIAGLPGHPIEDVVLAGIHLQFRGGGSSAAVTRVVPELESGYPEPDLFGPMPSWGLFARHAVGLNLRGVTLQVDAPDRRPAVTLDDVASVRLTDVQLTGTPPPPQWSLAKTHGVHARDVTGLPDGDLADVAEPAVR